MIGCCLFAIATSWHRDRLHAQRCTPYCESSVGPGAGHKFLALPRPEGLRPSVSAQPSSSQIRRSELKTLAQGLGRFIWSGDALAARGRSAKNLRSLR
eukprot:2897383-Pyramimonas_sp.AAC.1